MIGRGRNIDMKQSNPIQTDSQGVVTSFLGFPMAARRGGWKPSPGVDPGGAPGDRAPRGTAAQAGPLGSVPGTMNPSLGKWLSGPAVAKARAGGYTSDRTPRSRPKQADAQ